MSDDSATAVEFACARPHVATVVVLAARAVAGGRLALQGIALEVIEWIHVEWVLGPVSHRGRSLSHVGVRDGGFPELVIVLVERRG